MIRRLLQHVLMPGYAERVARLELLVQEADGYLVAMAASREHLKQLGQEGVEINGPVVFLGNASGCQFTVTPVIKPTVVLAQLELSSLLGFSGNYGVVQGNSFIHQDAAKATEDKQP